ncbi:MAG: precorrin-6y C5,15-methyltransferase (decarboxylating) subunit CbiE [Gammaproteobacteria bacterium]|nr:precorrin-6y C5,15-methyltransferase (decarboxylating) subunit CbiE [Gammaproteobacteria bacterium]
MNKVYVIGIGFKPLEKKTSHLVLNSDVVLTNDSLLRVFKNYPEYKRVQDRILVHGSVYETVDYIRENYRHKKLSLLAAGDPMFFGIGRLIVEKVGPHAVEIYPDLSSVQVAFSRIRETSSNALVLSLHGGPDPEKRRKLEYDITELPPLLEKHNKIAILTDKVNRPEKIAEVLLAGSKDSIARRPMGSSKQSRTAEAASSSTRRDNIRMYVCEKLGFADERVTEGTPEEISQMSFAHPNVVIIKSTKVHDQNSQE